MILMRYSRKNVPSDRMLDQAKSAREDDQANFEMARMAACSSGFVVEMKAPILKPFAQKSLLMPYSTCSNDGSINFLYSRESTDRNGTGLGMSPFGKTDIA